MLPLQFDPAYYREQFAEVGRKKRLEQLQFDIHDQLAEYDLQQMVCDMATFPIDLQREEATPVVA